MNMIPSFNSKATMNLKHHIKHLFIEHKELMFFAILIASIVSFLVFMFTRTDPSQHPEFSVSALNISSTSSSTTTLSYTLTVRYRDPKDTIHYNPVTATVLYRGYPIVNRMALSESPVDETEGRFEANEMRVFDDLVEGLRSDIEQHGGLLEFSVRSYSYFSGWNYSDRLRVACDGIRVGFENVTATRVFGSMVGPFDRPHRCKLEWD